ncbi:MAG: MFS transporter [Proteobacteria bacterium]|nr:MAG: MFS transporter [Pseudomonadota bacterium]
MYALRRADCLAMPWRVRCEARRQSVGNRSAESPSRRQGGIKMRFSRRKVLHLAGGAAALAAATRPSRAQTFPARPLTFVVFVPAGGTPDIIARLIGQALTQQIGQGVIIDNRPGAGGNLALQAVARAPADGYTLLQVASPHAVNVTLYEKTTITVTRDIVPVASSNNDSFVLMASPSFPVKSVAEFIAYAKANPGKINLASTGTGNMTHLCGELFKMMADINIVHVPFRGTPAAQSAVMAGDVHASFDAVGASVPLIQAGSLRALGVTARERLRVLPDVPPIADVVPGYTVRGFLGFGAPKGTPPEIVERLNREINAALANPAVKARMSELGSDIFTGSPADFGNLVAEETEKWAKVVKFAGLKAD